MILQYRYFYRRLQQDQNSYDIDVAELLEELIDNNDHLYLLPYYTNILTRRQQVEEVLKILQKVIIKNSFLLQRRDSEYGSGPEEIDQYAADDTKLYEEIVRRITKTLINAGINIGAYTDAHIYEKEETPLHWAVRENNIDLVNFFIEMGIDVDVQNNKGATALHMAVINDNPNIVKALIDKGAKINVKDDEGNTSLFFAVSCENYEIVKSLLDAGADPNVFCPLGNDLYVEIPELQDIKCTPLHLAAFIGNIDLINLLIKHKADINAVCKSKKYSCLHMAVLGVTCYYDEEISEEKEEEYLRVVDSLISESLNQTDVQDYEDNSPLHRAVSTKHEDTIRVLLSCGASLLQFRKGGYTPFHDAVSTGNLNLVKLLLENSNEKVINSVYRGEGFTECSPLHLAISAYNEYLDQKDDSSNVLEVIRYLLSYSTLDTNIQDFQGETPLHYAIKYIKDNELALILINELLTAENIHPFIKDYSNKTPFDYAIENNRNKILQALIDNKYGSDKDSLLHLAAEKGDVKAVEYLIKDQKFDVNSQNDLEITPLQLAASKGFINVVRALIRAGAISVSAQPAAFRAVLEGNLEIADLLLENSTKDIEYCFFQSIITIDQIYEHNSIDQSKSLENAKIRQVRIDNLIKAICHIIKFKSELDINIVDDRKRTALHYIIKSKLDINLKLELIEALLKREDINPFIKDAEDKTPIDYCTEQEKHDYPILGQYAKIQEERDIKIKNYKVKKYITYSLTLCTVNSVFAGIYHSQYTLGNITSGLNLIFITNIAALACCLIINKCVERSIETKHKNKVVDLFSNYAQVQEQSNHILNDLPISNELNWIDVENYLQQNCQREI